MVAKRRPPTPPDILRCKPLQNVEGLDKDWLYAYYDRDGELLYVGVSNDPARRATSHRSQSRWWRFVDNGEAVLIDLRRSSSIERDAIRHLEPLFNAQHAHLTIKAAIEYCARREAWDIVDQLIEEYCLDLGT